MPYIANPLEGIPIRNSFIVDQASLGAAAASDDTLLIYDISATALKQLTVSNLQAGILASPTFTGVPAAPTANAGTSTTQLATTAFVTTANAALNTITEMTDVTISSIASGEVLKWNGSAWINQTLAELGVLTVAGPTFTGVLTVGSAVISEADLEQIDDLTAGTAVASKALVVDSNKDIGTIRNLTIDGTFSDGNYTFDTSGNVTGLGTIGSGNITSTGTVQGTTITATTAFVPDASDGAALGTSALEFSDLFLADAAVISLGDDDDVTLTHVVDTGILLSSTDRFQFGDAGTFIHQSADGVLTIESDTTVDINGAVVFDGALSGITTLTASGVISAGGITLGSAVLIEAELELLDGLTAGTAIASKVVTTDGNIDTTGQRNLTITGELDAATGDFSGAVDVAGAFSLAGTAVTSTAAELNLLDGVSGLVQADLTKLAAINSTATELNLLDALDRGSILYGNASGVTTVLGQGGADTVLTSDGDDIAWQAVAAGTTLSGSTNNTIVTVTGSNAMIGEANLTFNGSTLALTGNMTISTDADIDGTLEADAYTVDGVALSTYIRDTVGTNMLSSNTESGIAVTYDTSNDNIDFALETAQTSLVTIYNAALKAGRDTENLIDFATTDDEIIFRVAGVNEVRLAANILSPVTSDGIALGTASLMWSDLFLASAGVINFNAGNMTITHTSAGLLTVAGGTLATAALTTSTIVASGIIKTDATTNATSITDGSLQTDGGLSVALDAIIGDDLTLISDAAVLNFGVNSDVSLTHVHDTGLLLNSTRQLQFGDAGTYIHQSADGVLDLVSDTEIELTATNIDINGAVDVSGTFTAGSYHGDTRYIFYRLVGYDTDLEASGTAIGGDFEFPFTGTITEVGTFNDTAGSSGTQVVDIHKGGTTLMTSDKLDTDTGEKTTRTAASAPALTTTAITEGDILTFFVDAIHSTAAKGLVVRLEVTVT